MEEPLFENRCVYTQEHLLEMAGAMRGAPHIALCVLVTAACLGGGVFCALRGSVWQAALLGVCAALYLALYFLLPRINAARMHKQFDALYHASVSVRVLFYGDRLTVLNDASGSETQIGYEQLSRAVRTKHLILLRVRPQIVVLLDRDGFVPSNLSAFEALLAQKAVHAKIRF